MVKIIETDKKKACNLYLQMVFDTPNILTGNYIVY